jgi:hypothetical protein
MEIINGELIPQACPLQAQAARVSVIGRLNLDHRISIDHRIDVRNQEKEIGRWLYRPG